MIISAPSKRAVSNAARKRSSSHSTGPDARLINLVHRAGADLIVAR